MSAVPCRCASPRALSGPSTQKGKELQSWTYTITDVTELVWYRLVLAEPDDNRHFGYERGAWG
jgi:hypothetical protein